MTKPDAIWRSRPVDADALARLLAADFRLCEPSARLLVARGISDPSEAEAHLSATLAALPDPFTLTGMQTACERVARAIKRRESILAWGDYDVDGITSLSLLIRFFRAIGNPIGHAIPRRLEDGYGLKENAVRELARQGVKLIITVDNGISSVDEVTLANELGMDVIVIDHHELGESVPAAVAIINPKQPDCGFEADNLAACGLSFMFLAGLRRYLVENEILARMDAPNLKDLLDIVALGTVADMVPLVGLNRLLVRHGLPLLSRSRRAGILALKEVSGLDVDAEVDAFTVGFTLAPRINAGGRLGDALTGVDLLTSDELPEARQYAYLLNRRNSQRRLVEQRVLESAIAAIDGNPEYADAPALIVTGEGWHEGVVGLAASRLADRYHKPAIVLNIENGTARGSCRSIPGLHIQQALMVQKDLLQHFGGHAQAAGLTMAAENLEIFKARFCSHVADILRPEDYIPVLDTDGDLPLSELSFDLLDDIARLAPFGIGHAAPLFVARRVTVIAARLLKEKHWKLTLENDRRRLDAIAFNQGLRVIEKGDVLDIAYVPEYNTYKGTRSIQVRIRDLRKSEGG
jgi:single-stranded-DNA-specific exonuclease